jgi:hypothetical protein
MPPVLVQQLKDVDCLGAMVLQAGDSSSSSSTYYVQQWSYIMCTSGMPLLSGCSAATSRAISAVCTAKTVIGTQVTTPTTVYASKGQTVVK